MAPRLTPAILLELYRDGCFPMADGLQLHVHDPDPRAIFDLHSLRPNTRLQRYFRSHGYGCTENKAFEAVMRACADRPERWIDEDMVQAYTALHHLGHARSVETWQGGGLIGGIYGVQLGRVFFGESMFSRKPNASKAAFFHLAERLRAQGFLVFDTQYINDHTRSLGAFEVSRTTFRAMLKEALGT